MGTRRMAMTAIMMVATMGAAEIATAGPAAAAPKPTLLTLTIAKGEATKPAQRRAFLTCAPAFGNACSLSNATGPVFSL